MKLEQDYYMIPEVARLTGVSKISAWRWVKLGKVEVYRPHPEVTLIPKSEVIRLRKERGLS